MIEIDMNKIKEIRDRFNHLENLNEANIKIKIVLDLLNVLGYDYDSFDFEHKVHRSKKTADIGIKIDNEKYFYVEVKNGYKDLSKDDIMQLVDYLSAKSTEWGLLTNGRELMLINNDIKTESKEGVALEDKIVLRINLMTIKKVNNLRFMSMEAIFETGVTEYFKAIAQFKAYKFPGDNKNFNVYKGTLNNFFNYFVDKENKYVDIEKIREDEFKSFLEYEQDKNKDKSKSINSQNTFKNKYSHIRSMLNELEKQKYINKHNFKEERDKLIGSLEYKESDKDKDFLNKENISRILEFIDNTQSPIRNKVIFLLSAYAGLDRSTLRNMEVGMFNLDKNIIKINKRIIPLPSKLKFLIKELIKENKSRKIKGGYLFYSNYSKKYNVMSESAINDLFILFKNIDINDKKWTMFSPQYVRDCLIGKLFEKNYSIEEISYLTGMDLKNISNYISPDKINSKVNLFKNKRSERKHPFEKSLEI